MSKIQIQLSDGRNINLDLYEDVAPITVKNFKKLIKENFFDGLCFHRTIKDFMIQGGGFVADGRAIKEKGGADTIKGEFMSNGVKNDLHHGEGVISMARTNVKDSASSQFSSALPIVRFWTDNMRPSGKLRTRKVLRS